MYHSNYHVESDYDYEDLYQNNFREYNRKRKKKKNYSVIIGSIVFFVILLVGIIVFTNKDSFTNEYLELENNMLESTRNFIVNNDISIIRNSYFSSSELGIFLEDVCNPLSGVMVTLDGSYKPYLLCDDYKKNIINNNSSDITLIGEDVMFVSDKEIFVDPGYVSEYDVKVSNNVKKEKGVYEVLYNVIVNSTIKESVKRIVIVLDDEYVKSMYPLISLVGEEVIYLEKGSEYQELGYFASDSIDGDLRNQVVINNNVNIKQEGEYFINYQVTNSRGFSKSIKRIVNVVDNTVSEMNVDYYVTPINNVNDKVTITLYVSGNNYSRMLLPNDEENVSNTINYVVTENGSYTFNIIDKNNQVINKTIEIANIDRSIPTITCSAELYNGYVLINANGVDPSGISSYEYLVDGNSSRPISSTSYSMSLSDAKSVKVKVMDTAGNTSEASCQIIDKRVAVIPTSPFCSDDVIYKGKKYSLTDAQKKKLAAMVTAEYGSDIVGMKMVASHMANLYEYKKWSGAISSNKSFYSYITTTNWYASGTKSKTKYSDLALKAVEQCIVNGERTLPLYIDEFDWFPNDIKNPKKSSEYVRLKTSVKNVYGSSGKFWCISQNSKKTDANIFFYKSDKYKQLVG